MKKLLFALCFISFNLSAQSICERLDHGITSYLENESSRISFKNKGGLFNGGVCWWHSRLQRSSAYLVEFKPELAKPTKIQARDILRHLKQMDQMVTIPGFEDFKTFTGEFQAETQSLLEFWQREDGFINQQWVRGISGKYELEAAQMKDRMETLHDQFLKSPHPIWVMAQIKGVSSHAFLILDFYAIENGYRLSVIDSNLPTKPKLIDYQEGQRFLKAEKDKFSFVPYLGFQKDFELIEKSVEKVCGNIFKFESSEIPRGDIEVSP